MEIAAAEKIARALFADKGRAVESVTRYSQPAWRDSGWKGFRVTMAGSGEVHWLTPQGAHEQHVCCNPRRMTQDERSPAPVVVKRATTR